MTMLRSRAKTNTTSDFTQINEYLPNTPSKNYRPKKRGSFSLVFASFLFLLVLGLGLAFHQIFNTSFLSSLSSSSSSSSSQEAPVVISYKLIRGLPYNSTFDPFYACKADGYTGARAAVAPAFSKKGVVDFNVQLSTSLKILIVGDSVGIQFSQALQEAAGANTADRHVVKYAWRDHEGVHLASPVSGGGAVAGFRITGLFRYSQKDNHFQLAPISGGGWMQQHVDMLKEAVVNSTATAAGETKTKPAKGGAGAAEQGNFDVVIHQFPYGWLERPPEIHFTQEALFDAVNTSHHVFGAKTVILQTVPLQNNVFDMKQELINVNNAIFDFSNNYIPPSDGSGVQTVMVMDIAWFSFNLFAHNAAGLKMIPSSHLKILKQRDQKHSYHGAMLKLVDILNPVLDKRMGTNKLYRRIVGHSCAEVVGNSTKDCKGNIYSNDGMHWCMVS